MEIDEYSGQSRFLLWNLVIGIPICCVIYAAGFRTMAQGVLFGLVVMLLNYKLLGKILNKAFNFAAFDIARILSFVCYHVRFWLLILVMFLVIPKKDLYFGIGTFLGLLIPKFSIGITLLRREKEEWWSQDFQASEPPEPVLSCLEKELSAKNPFEVDPVGVEVNRYLKQAKKDKEVC